MNHYAAKDDAVAALTARIRRCKDEHGDPYVAALQYVTELMAHGWRQTEARPPPPWKPAAPPATETGVHEWAATIRQTLPRKDPS